MTQDIKNLVNLKTIKEAEARIRSIVRPTPVKYSPYLSREKGQNIYLKLENLNIAGAFKIRGATNALLKNIEKAKSGVIAASSGNHAQGVAYICREYNVCATIFMPTTAPYKKISSTEQAGAKVQLEGLTYNEAYDAAMAYQQEHGGLFIHPFGDADVIAGQGTIGLELMSQVEKLDAVIMPIGGGGLASGVACALKNLVPDVKIIGVQTKYYPAMQNKFLHLKSDKHAYGSTIADGIAVKQPSDITCDLVEEYVDEIVLVDESEITSSMLTLMEFDYLVAEGAGAAATAALVHDKSEVLKKLKKDSHVVSVVSGGNVDISMVSKIVARGLYMSGRFMRVKVKLQDKPGSLNKLLSQIHEEKVNILEIHHNRVFSAEEAYIVDCDIDLETVSKSQQEALIKKLKTLGYQVDKR